MRVRELEARLGNKIDITWRSFLLRTEPKTTSLEKFVEYSKSWERPQAAAPEAKFTTPWASGETPPESSLPAQVAWKASALFGPEMQDAYHEALLDAYFTRNRNIADWTILVDIAEQVGMDRAEFTARLEENKQHFASWVIDEHNSAIRDGITAVPTVVIGDVFPVPGAQDAETYVRLVERFIERREQIIAAADDAAASQAAPPEG